MCFLCKYVFFPIRRTPKEEQESEITGSMYEDMSSMGNLGEQMWLGAGEIAFL